jgi:hypothetical protein
MGSPATIAAFADFSIFQLPNDDVTTIQDVQVFFVDLPSQGENGLMVAILPFGQSSYTVTVFTSTDGATYSPDGFSVNLTNQSTGDQIIVTSDDVDSSGNLRGTIQMKAFDASGNFIGQFSVLAGYQH